MLLLVDDNKINLQVPKGIAALFVWSVNDRYVADVDAASLRVGE